MFKKKSNRILKTLIVIMVGVNIALAVKYFYPGVSEPDTVVAKDKEISIDIASISNRIKAVNKNKVLENTLTATYTFDDENKKLIESSSNKVGFIKKALAQLTYNSVEITQEYKYDVSYDFNKLVFSNTNDELIIDVYEDNLEYSDLAASTKPKITRDNGILATDFSSIQTLNMSYFLAVEARNHVINDNKIRNEAMDSLKNNLEKTIRRINPNLKYKINVINSNLLDYEEDNLNIK